MVTHHGAAVVVRGISHQHLDKYSPGDCFAIVYSTVLYLRKQLMISEGWFATSEGIDRLEQCA